MMSSLQLQNLRTITEQLSLALIREANSDGVIRTPNADGTVGVDIPATHHLVEVLERLDRDIFWDGIEAGVYWLANADKGVSDHPFALDSLAILVHGQADHEALFRSAVADRQLKDGSIPVFTAYLPGGDYFSTLWATKVLSRYSPQAFASEIDRALNYLISRREIGC